MNTSIRALIPLALALAMESLCAQNIKTSNTSNEPQLLIEKCQSLGYVKGTERMKQCISQVYANKQQEMPDEMAIEKCQSLGYVKGTERMKQCLGSVYTAKQQDAVNEVMVSTNPVGNESKASPAEQKCDGYGFQRGTTAYSQCLMNIDAQNNQAAYQQSIQQQQQFRNAAELLRGDGRTPGSMNCYGTPGGAGGVYCR